MGSCRAGRSRLARPQHDEVVIAPQRSRRGGHGGHGVRRFGRVVRRGSRRGVCSALRKMRKKNCTNFVVRTLIGSVSWPKYVDADARVLRAAAHPTRAALLPTSSYARGEGTAKLVLLSADRRAGELGELPPASDWPTTDFVEEAVQPQWRRAPALVADAARRATSWIAERIRREPGGDAVIAHASAPRRWRGGPTCWSATSWSTTRTRSSGASTRCPYASPTTRRARWPRRVQAVLMRMA